MSRDGDQARHGEGDAGVGSVAEEAAKLLGALQNWAGEHGSAPGETAQRLTEGIRVAADHVGHGQDCRYCPVCIAINRVRQTSPEVREHLAAALDSLARAATAALRSEDAACSEQEARSPTKVDLDE